eukprot:CAMPEP_0113674054 /NCGR_PEP_ID=MMETSP0038_2-20120614/7198_1 /TAXON_ID=2898 /ORGANISM="Cryptomonas paramecium" /LENGTH=329 /DNA_ID=CAMNT_0000590577 /DNA_START=22 /DNA_END=1008 /DNA_ORIENTATION=+ /assembly_acc=CAM_ASM_000170
MSSIYQNMPPTNGKVVLNTSCGDIEIELWSKEAPMACRNFIQLSLEGYYDNTMFHRIIPKFMVQGGDPTGTGQGGESCFGQPFKDEIHSRLRFMIRGMVAMANGGRDDNNSQFFMTLAPCDWLNGRHTIFGKVTGKTIYNLDAMSGLETGPEDRPLYPPRINSVEVILNPFTDIVPRRLEAAPAPADGANRPTVKVCKNKALLSFGDEAEAEEPQAETAKRMVSAHEALDDPRLSRLPAGRTEEDRRADDAQARRDAGGGGSSDSDDSRDSDDSDAVRKSKGSAARRRAGFVAVKESKLRLLEQAQAVAPQEEEERDRARRAAEIAQLK